MGNNTILATLKESGSPRRARVCHPNCRKGHSRGEPIRGDAGTSHAHAALTEFEEARALAGQRAADLAELTRSRVDAAGKKYGLVPTSLKLQGGPGSTCAISSPARRSSAWRTAPFAAILGALDERDGDVATGDVADEAGKDR
jgi:hypothetical protein